MQGARWMLTGLVALFLASCGASSSGVNLQAAKAVGSSRTGNGLVVTRMHSNWTSGGNPLFDDIRFYYKKSGALFNSGSIAITRPVDLKIISLPAGNYNWSHLSFAGGHLGLKGRAAFSVRPGTMTYIGDIHVQRIQGTFRNHVRMWVTNNMSDIVSVLRKQKPGLLKKYRLVRKLTHLR